MLTGRAGRTGRTGRQAAEPGAPPRLRGRLRLARRSLYPPRRGDRPEPNGPTPPERWPALLELFWDEENGGFFTSGSDAEVLIARMKDVYDGAVPSANATAALALARLGELTGEASFSDAAARTVDLMSPAMSRAPSAFPGTGPRRQLHLISPDARWSSTLGPRRSSVRFGSASARHRARLGRAVPLAAMGGPDRPREQGQGLRVRELCLQAAGDRRGSAGGAPRRPGALAQLAPAGDQFLGPSTSKPGD